jgi:hypothetical protein
LNPSSNLINEIFLKNYDNEVLSKMEDAAVLNISGDKGINMAQMLRSLAG